jgi:hypothetical protein
LVSANPNPKPAYIIPANTPNPTGCPNPSFIASHTKKCSSSQNPRNCCNYCTRQWSHTIWKQFRHEKPGNWCRSNSKCKVIGK